MAFVPHPLNFDRGYRHQKIIVADDGECNGRTIEFKKKSERPEDKYSVKSQTR